jgi:hypothetical protein
MGHARGLEYLHSGPTIILPYMISRRDLIVGHRNFNQTEARCLSTSDTFTVTSLAA